METERPSLSASLAALATGAEAAEKAASLSEMGGRPSYEAAWSGATTPEEKQRLKGSIVKLHNDKFAYLPVISSAALLKMAGRGEDASRGARIKI